MKTGNQYLLAKVNSNIIFGRIKDIEKPANNCKNNFLFLINKNIKITKNGTKAINLVNPAKPKRNPEKKYDFLRINKNL